MIAVYDSGLGGILSLNKVIDDNPDERIVYFGDCRNAPYGNKDPNDVSAIIEKNITHLCDVGSFDIILACNTVCSIVDFDIKRDVMLHDIIRDTVAQIKMDKTSKVMVFGTNITIRMGRYAKELHDAGYDNVCSYHLDKLAGYIEEFKDHDFLREYLYGEFSKIKYQPDAIILACTHYPVAQDIFEEYYDVPVYNSRDLSFKIEHRHDGHEVLIDMEPSDKLNEFLKRYLKYDYRFYEESNTGIR